ncbi:MAG: hypothetical protein ACM3JB_02530 [Acidobacteriaceae bacterium]
MIRSHSTVLKALIAISAIVFTCTSSAQRRTTKKPPALAPTPSPSLKNCGLSLHIPPGWELAPSPAHPQAAPGPGSAEPSANSDTPQSSTEAPAPASADADATASPSCSFVLGPKFPSEIVRNTDTEGPIGRMELQIVDGDLDTAAPQVFQKDEKGWYITGPQGSRYDGKLTKQRRPRMDILSAVIVQRCYDSNGKFRSLCESNRYVYTDGRRSVLVSAGPYLGETEYTVLNSIRFAPTPRPSPTRKKKR